MTSFSPVDNADWSAGSLHLPSVVDEALLDATRIGMLAEQVSLPLEPWQQRVIDLACIVDRTGARPHRRPQ